MWTNSFVKLILFSIFSCVSACGFAIEPDESKDELSLAREHDPNNILLDKKSWKVLGGKEIQAELAWIKKTTAELQRFRGIVYLNEIPITENQKVEIEKLSGGKSFEQLIRLSKGAPINISYETLGLKDAKGRVNSWPIYNLDLTFEELQAARKLVSIKFAKSPSKRLPEPRPNPDPFRSDRESREERLASARKTLIEYKNKVLTIKKQIVEIKADVKRHESSSSYKKGFTSGHAAATRSLGIAERQLIGMEERVHKKEIEILELEKTIAKLQPR